MIEGDPMPARHRRKPLALIAGLAVVATAMLGLTGCSSASSAASNTDHAPFVALSNSFIGNSWRQSMVNQFQSAAKKAVANGTISGYKIANAPGANSATNQIAQIKTLLLQKPDILLIDPASPTALTPVIQQACSIGVTVVVFDSASEAPCATVVTNSFPDWAKVSTEAVIKGMGGKGNLLISRGVVGSAPEAEFYAAQKKVLAKYPNVKVVGTVTGFCDSATAQKAVLGVLSSLPKIDGVAGCGDGYGIAQAFQTANRKIPVLAFEPSGRALRFWENNKVASGSIAIMSDPGQVTAAFYTSLDIRKGRKVASTVIFPSVEITEQQRAAWLPHVDQDAIAAWPWTQALVDKQLTADADKTTTALPPVPGS
jgi:ribose transport system substrate-binding protein